MPEINPFEPVFEKILDYFKIEGEENRKSFWEWLKVRPDWYNEVQDLIDQITTGLKQGKKLEDIELTDRKK